MKKILFSIVFGTIFISLPVLAAGQTRHLNGALVSHNGTVFRMLEGTRQAYPSAEIFLSYGHSFDEVIPANKEDLKVPIQVIAPFADGTLINDNGTVYIMYDGEKYGFVSAEVFIGLGYRFGNVISADVSNVELGGLITDSAARHSYGSLIKDAKGTIYVMDKSWYRPIPSMNVFNSHKYRLDMVVSANEDDLAEISSGELANYGNLSWANGTLVMNEYGGVYFIEGGMKHPFLDENAFLEDGFDYQNAVKVAEDDTADLLSGEPLD